MPGDRIFFALVGAVSWVMIMAFCGMVTMYINTNSYWKDVFLLLAGVPLVLAAVVMFVWAIRRMMQRTTDV